MIVFVKMKLSQLGFKCLCDWDREWRITLAWKWSYVWLVCTDKQVKHSSTFMPTWFVTEPAVCGNEDRLLWTRPFYNFIQIMDLLKPNFKKSYERMRRKWGIPQTFPVEYLGNGLSYDETRAAGAHRQFLQFFQMFKTRVGETKSPTISGNSLLGKRRAVAGAPNDKFEFFDGECRRKGAKVEEPEFSFLK